MPPKGSEKIDPLASDGREVAWPYPFLLASGVGVVALGLVVSAWFGRWGGFWGTVFGAVLAAPMAAVASLIALPLAVAIRRTTSWSEGRKSASAVFLWFGFLGNVMLATNLAWSHWPPPVPTLERPGLGAAMPEPRPITRPPSTGILDLATGLAFPSTFSSEAKLAVIDPETGAFSELKLGSELPLERSQIFSGASDAGWILLESEPGWPPSNPRVFELDRFGHLAEQARLGCPDAGVAYEREAWSVTGDGHYVIHSVEHKGAPGSSLSTNPAQVEVSLLPLAPNEPPRSLVIATHDHHAGNLVWSADGTSMAYSDSCQVSRCGSNALSGTEGPTEQAPCCDCVFIAGPTGEHPRAILHSDVGRDNACRAGRGNPAITRLRISPNGANVAVLLGSPRELWIAPVSGSEPHRISLPGQENVVASILSVAWSPDSARLAVLSNGLGDDHGGLDMGYYRDASVYTVAADGGGVVRLSERTQTAGQLLWYR